MSRAFGLTSGFRPSLCDLIAHPPKIFVPHFREGGDQVLDFAPSDDHSRMHNVAPRMHFRPFGPVFKCHPLAQGYADGVVNPAYALPWRAAGDYVVDDRVDGVQQLNLHSTSWFPGLSLLPSNLAIDIRKLIPSPPVGEYVPGQSRTGLGCNTVVKTNHRRAVTFPFELELEARQRYT
jgi:hypothetical protein